MNPLIAAARELLDLLDHAGLTACLIGGLVVERWGEPRLTRDVDATVLAEYGQEAPVIEAVLAGLAPRRPDAREFALTYRVLLARASNGVDIDLSLAALDFEREVSTSASRSRCLSAAAARRWSSSRAASRRMKRSVSLLVSDRDDEGTYQSPILVQWHRGARRERVLEVTLTRFV